jgi:hypothetical protein
MAQDNASIVRGFVDEVITNGNIEDLVALYLQLYKGPGGGAAWSRTLRLPTKSLRTNCA